MNYIYIFSYFKVIERKICIYIKSNYPDFQYYFAIILCVSFMLSKIKKRTYRKTFKCVLFSCEKKLFCP